MAPPRVKSKWRPPLSWIVFSTLLIVLALPASIVIGIRAIDGTVSQMGPLEITAICVALGITLVIAVVFSRTLTGPINALIRTTEAIGRGGVVPVLPPDQHGTRELATLSQSFLDLAARLGERTEYVQSFAAHVSHELRSPLTAIRGSAELLLDDDMPAADRRRFAAHIVADSDRLTALLDRLRLLARADVPLDGKGVPIRRLAELLQQGRPRLNVASEGAVDVEAALSEEAAMIVLGHLADNAMQHGARRLTLQAAAGPAMLVLQVADDGTGISPGNRARVFEPFFTTRREQGGTGMGLDIVRTMLQAHGGTIALVESERGATFRIAVPLQ